MAEEEKQEEQQKKGSPLLIILIAGFLVLLLIVGGVLFFVLSGDDEVPQQQNTAAANNMDNTPVNDGGSEFKSAKRKSSIEVGPMLELDTFIVNLISENGRRYLKIKLNLELENEELQNEINQKIPVIRDIIIRIASSKTMEEISTERGKEKFKDQVVAEINSILKDGKINNVFFTEFVIQ